MGPGKGCFNFNHNMYGADVGYLKLFKEFGHRREELVNFRGEHTDQDWYLAGVDFDSSSDFQLVFEGKCREGLSCSINITDIVFEDSSSCKSYWSPGFFTDPCTFDAAGEPLCNWTPTSSDEVHSFTWKNEGGLDNLDPAAPKMDFTYGATGHYAYVAPLATLTNKSMTAVTQLRSPTLESGSGCMVFAYHMTQLISGTLNVYLVEPGKSTENPIWTAYVSDSDWSKGVVTLDSETSDFQVVFEVSAEQTMTKGLAVDDIHFNTGSCRKWTDSCGFTDSLCFWTNVEDGSDSFDWELRHKEKTTDDGPQKDHTDPNSLGYYMMAGKDFGNEGETAQLRSQMHFPSKNTEMCVKFFYFMSGTGSATLTMSIIRGFKLREPTVLKLWELETNETQRAKWLEAHARVDKRFAVKPFEIEIKATIGDGGVAIDDIVIQPNSCEIFPEEALPEELVLMEASCSFEEESVCGWKNDTDSTNATQWNLKKYGSSIYVRNFGYGKYQHDNDGYMSLMFDETDGKEQKAVLKSPTFLPSNGVDCLNFWYYVRQLTAENLKVKMTYKDQEKTIWHGSSTYLWVETNVNIYSKVPFQILFESSGVTGHGEIALDDIHLSHGPCLKDIVECDFNAGSWCGYTQDDTDDFDWKRNLQSWSTYELSPDVSGRSAEEKARIKSPIYTGGGPQCLVFTYSQSASIAGEFFVYAQKVLNTRLGKKLWTMPYLKTLDVSEKREVHVDVHKTSPFRIVFEHKVGVANGESPSLHSVSLLSHPCGNLGWCDFESSHCGYQSSEYPRFSQGTRLNPDSTYPYADHTLGDPIGYYAASYVWNERTLESPVLPSTSASCLTFAYALFGSVKLEVRLDIDDQGRKSVLNLTDTTEVGHQVHWETAQVDVEAEQPFILLFAASQNEEMERSKYMTASFDDIKLLPGSCDDQTPPPPPTKAPIPYVIQDLSCDFESSKRPLCGYSDGQNVNGYWQRSVGDWNTTGLGFDHTRGDSTGAFAAMSSTSDSEVAEAYLEAFSSMPDEVPHCVSFWYHMRGNPFNKLSLYVKGDKPLWQRSGEQNLVWQHALVDLGIEDVKVDKKGSAVDFSFAIKFQGILAGRGGHIVLDDIEFYNSSCPLPDRGICTFEDDGICDYSQDIYDTAHWERRKADDFFGKDHTYGTSQGHIMSCAFKGIMNPTSLISPVFKGSNDGWCLVFWYELSVGGLKVLIKDQENHQTQLVELYYKKAGWETEHVDIRSRSDFQIVFQAEESQFGNGKLSLDDIQMTQGRCVDIYDCDFGRGLCAWTQTFDGNAEWGLTSGLPPPGQSLVGPDRDHTTNSAAGQYIILQGAPESRYLDVATLHSQDVFLSTDARLCFSFWYHMSDSSAGSLTVSVADKTWGPFKHGEAGWIHERMNVYYRRNQDMQILVAGKVKPGKQNYIALDDLHLDGLACEHVTDKPLFSCRDDSQTKVPYDKVCDFASDCDNEADEEDCSSCDFEKSSNPWCRWADITATTQDPWKLVTADATSENKMFPNVDGHFLTLDKSRGVLQTSNSFKMSSPSCKLRFSLGVPRLDYPDTMMVTVKIRTHMDVIPIFTHVIAYDDEEEEEDWTLKEVFIGNFNVPFQIEIHGVSTWGDIMGIDNIQLVDCGFPSPKSQCASDEFTCDNKVCIPDYQVCDLSNHCGDFSDENDCDSYLRDDFEYSLGNWIAERDISDASWEVTPLYASGGFTDHTPGSLQGSISSPAGLYYKDPLSAAFLISPVFAPTDDLESSNLKPCQIRFFYMMDSSKYRIYVYTKRADSGKLVELTDSSTYQEGHWTRFVATLSESSDFQIVIEYLIIARKITYASEGTENAVDDISLSGTCSVSKSTDTPVPIAAKPTHDEFMEATTTTIGVPDSTTLHADVPDTTTLHVDVPDTTTLHVDVPDTTTLHADVLDTTTLHAGVPDTTTQPPNVPSTTKQPQNAPDTKERTPDVSPSKRNGQGAWQLPVGLTLGFVALALVAVGILIYLRRTNRLSRLHIPSPRREIGYVNALFDENNEPDEMPGVSSSRPQSAVMALDNPMYEEQDIFT